MSLFVMKLVPWNSSREFIDSVKNLLVVNKKVIVVVHHKLQHPQIEQFKKKSSLIINIDLENRVKLIKYC